MRCQHAGDAATAAEQQMEAAEVIPDEEATMQDTAESMAMNNLFPRSDRIHA